MSGIRKGIPNDGASWEAAEGPQGALPELQGQEIVPQSLPTGRTFGEILRGVRERRGFKQPQFAKLLGQSTSYVSLLESNQRRPTERVLNNLKSAIELTSAEEESLTSAASIPDPMEQLVQYAVYTLGARSGADDFQRMLLREDMLRIFRSYQSLLQGNQFLAASKFGPAHDQFDRIVSGEDTAALPALVRCSAAVALSDVALKQGETLGAENALVVAMELLDGPLATSALPLRAEAEGMRGMIALQSGRYPDALDYLTNSLAAYSNLMTAAPSEKAVAAIGITKSYNRLALLALSQGDAVSAHSYCKSALDALKEVSPDENDFSNPYRARLIALQAWAHVQDGNFDEARKLRQHACEAYEARHDKYGLAKTWLYMADDARVELQNTVELGDANLASTSTRLVTYQTRLNKPDMRKLAKRASEYYLRSAEDLLQLGEALLLSRAFRGLGDMHRYAALVQPNVSAKEFAASRRHLQRALDLEKRAAQARLTPETLESFARLEWDEGHLAPARDYFSDAIASLDKTSSPEDAAAAALLRRCKLGLQQVKEALAAESSQSMSKASPTQPLELSPEWRSLLASLADAVFAAIVRGHVEPETTSSLTLQWTERLSALDQRQGPRLIAQSELSTSLESQPLPEKGAGRIGVEAESDRAYDLHVARYIATESRIKEADEQPEAGNAYIDICVRQAVEEGVEQNDHGRKRAREALYRLRNWGNGYSLVVAEEPMPIHFLLKGRDVALVELTYEACAIDPRLSRYVAPDSETCIPFQDATLVEALCAIATKVRRIVERQGLNANQTIAWLEQLVNGSTPELEMAAAGAPTPF